MHVLQQAFYQEKLNQVCLVVKSMKYLSKQFAYRQLIHFDVRYRLLTQRYHFRRSHSTVDRDCLERLG